MRLSPLLNASQGCDGLIESWPLLLRNPHQVARPNAISSPLKRQWNLCLSQPTRCDNCALSWGLSDPLGLLCLLQTIGPLYPVNTCEQTFWVYLQLQNVYFRQVSRHELGQRWRLGDHKQVSALIDSGRNPNFKCKPSETVWKFIC